MKRRAFLRALVAAPAGLAAGLLGGPRPTLATIGDPRPELVLPIEIVIRNGVRSAIERGDLDRVMRDTYGLRRR